MPSQAEIARFAAPALELINSLEPDGRDRLEEPAWLQEALVRWGLSRGRAPSSAEREALRGLRALLRRLAAPVAAGRPLSPSELGELNAVLARSPVSRQLELAGDGGYVVDLQPLARDWPSYVVGDVVGSFGSLLRSSHDRLRLCANEECRRAFLDQSRSRSRLWCDARGCGNRMRVRRHRARES
jgi:predicted RNA-binding Zn ribbon-like protein